MNFGQLNTAIKKHIAENFFNNTSTKLLKEYVEMLKKDAVLADQFFLYKNLSNLNESVNIKSYVNDNLQLVKKHTPEQIKESNNKLIGLMKKYNCNVKVETNPLHENISYLLVNNKTLRNINIMENKVNNIYTLLESCKIEETEETDFNVNEVSEEEMKLAESLYGLSDDSKEEMFNEQKSNCIVLVNNIIEENKNDMDVNNKLLNVKIKLLEQKFDKKTFINDYITLMELTSDLM